MIQRALNLGTRSFTNTGHKVQKESTQAEFREYWNSISDFYEKHYQESATPLYSLAISHANLLESKQILDAGCGAGNGLQVLRANAQDHTEIYGCDISDVMVGKSQTKHLKNTTVVQADSENLPFEPESFDRYFSNLTLQIVKNPEKMLTEAYRVLKPKSVAAFSVWGKASDTNFFQLINKACEEAGYNMPTHKRNNFHLNNDKLLRKIIRNAGFSGVQTYYTSTAFSLANSGEANTLIEAVPGFVSMRSKSPELYEKSVANLKRYIANLLENGNAVTFDALMAIAYK